MMPTRRERFAPQAVAPACETAEVAQTWPYFGLLRGSSNGPRDGAFFAPPSNARAYLAGLAEATYRPQYALPIRPQGVTSEGFRFRAEEERKVRVPPRLRALEGRKTAAHGVSRGSRGRSTPSKPQRGERVTR